MSRHKSLPAAPTNLPTLKFEVVSGEKFVKIQAAAQLSGVHPVALEMAQELAATQFQSGATFALKDDKMIAKAHEIRDMFVRDLTKIAKAFQYRVKVEAVLTEDRLAFWFKAKQTRTPRKP
jgi:hypothetical protein